jgi:GR25 family glycosyltransferase involved in LPS biosynthesis
LQNVTPTPNTTNVLDGFGPLYIINLKRRTDRYERMMNLINDNKIAEYTFIDAVDGTENIDYLIDNVEQKHRDMAKMSEIATTISHIKAIEHWINTSDSKYAIFAEDDLSDETIQYWGWTWKEFISSIDFDYDVLQL